MITLRKMYIMKKKFIASKNECATVDDLKNAQKVEEYAKLCRSFYLTKFNIWDNRDYYNKMLIGEKKNALFRKRLSKIISKKREKALKEYHEANEIYNEMQNLLIQLETDIIVNL